MQTCIKKDVMSIIIRLVINRQRSPNMKIKLQTLRLYIRFGKAVFIINKIFSVPIHNRRNCENSVCDVMCNKIIILSTKNYVVTAVGFESRGRGDGGTCI
jgi:hypothetical protein